MPAKLIEEVRPALIAVGFFLMAATLVDFVLNSFTILAGFSAAFAVYLADHELPKKNKGAWPGIAVASALFGLFAWKSGQLSWIAIGFYTLLSFAYVFRWFPGKRRLQDFLIMRVLAIAIGWAALPLLLDGFLLTRSSLVYITGMAAFVLPAIFWSDVADTESDDKAGRRTLAVTLSIKRRTLLILSALSLSILCFSLPRLHPMLPGPVLYLFLFRFLNRHPQHSDWVLLWPLAGSFI